MGALAFLILWTICVKVHYSTHIAYSLIVQHVLVLNIRVALCGSSVTTITREGYRTRRGHGRTRNDTTVFLHSLY